MTINGMITWAGEPSEPTGQHKIIYQDITITDQQGKEWYGRIGSKQGYQDNTSIIVTVEEKQGQEGTYNYFRKYDPQYQDRAAPQRTREAPSQPVQSQKSPNKGNPPDWDAIAEGKVRTLLVGAGIESGQIKIDPNRQIADLEYWTNYCMTGRAPIPPQTKRIQTEPDAPEPSDVPY